MKQYAVIHHSITPRDFSPDKTEQSFNNRHKRLGYPKSKSGSYIGYHLVIFGNGELRRYRADNETGAHTSQYGMNYKSLGICLTGSFDTEMPSDAQIATLTKVLRDYGFSPERINPHRKYATYKSCYGDNLSDSWASNLITNNEDTMKIIVNSKGELALRAGNGEFERKIVLGDIESLGLFGNEIWHKIPDSEYNAIPTTNEIHEAKLIKQV